MSVFFPHYVLEHKMSNLVSKNLQNLTKKLPISKLKKFEIT